MIPWPQLLYVAVVAVTLAHHACERKESTGETLVLFACIIVHLLLLKWGGFFDPLLAWVTSF
jgi:hypothetical protein